MNLTHFIDAATERLDKSFHHYLSNTQKIPAPILQEAMAYAVLNGGKRIRPILLYLCGDALGAPLENLDGAACAIELIHAYSLIHDDLPAMDNSDLRRGKPTCHKAYNEALAILAGDALQPLAFEIIAAHPSALSAQQRLDMIHALSQACGTEGMAAGQTLDLIGVDSLQKLTKMHRLKTGALLVACAKLGAIAAEAAPDALEKYAECIGLAFQIQDDLLDLESTTEDLGKPQGLDNANQKVTYPSLAGIAASREKIHELFESAKQSIAFLGEKSQLLHEFSYYLLQRKK